MPCVGITRPRQHATKMTSYSFTDEQFQTLVEAFRKYRQGSFTSCNVRFDGTDSHRSVDCFLSAITVYREIENVSKEDALHQLPLILEGQAATWWLGVQDQVHTWEEFEKRLRNTFGPKKPAHIIYQEIFSIKQGSDEPTEKFIAERRKLFSQLPKPEHSETQQLDMLYGLLNAFIREKIPRTRFISFDGLLDEARTVEGITLQNPIKKEIQKVEGKKRTRCNFCKNLGHIAEDCRKRLRSLESTEYAPKEKMTKTVETQYPCPSEPKFSCYGCGAPGVARSQCVVCIAKPPTPIDHIVFN